MFQKTGIFVLLAAMASSVASAGTITQIATRAGIGANDSIVWSTLGSEFDPVTGGNTANSVAFTLSGATTFTLLSGSTYNADFLPGDALVSPFDLNNGPLSGNIRITLAAPVRRGGAQIQINAFGVPFSGVLEAFGLGGVSMGSVSVNSQVNDPSLNDGSAVFLGLESSLNDIYALEFSSRGNNIAINTVSLFNDPGTPEIPEPGTMVLMSAGLALVAVGLRRRVRS